MSTHVECTTEERAEKFNTVLIETDFKAQSTFNELLNQFFQENCHLWQEEYGLEETSLLNHTYKVGKLSLLLETPTEDCFE